MRVVVLALVLSPTLALAQAAPAPILPAGVVAVPMPQPQPQVVPQPQLAPAPSQQLVIVPAPAAAEPSECVTTTTVRCTGAAAPYAVPQPQPPAIVVPAPQAPPQPMARPTLMLDPRTSLGDGWHLEQTPDGVMWRTRKRSTDSPAVWGTGLALWLGSYAIAAGVGTSNGDFTLIGWWPILGAFFAAAGSSTDSAKTAWAIDGVAQVGGFVAFLVGLAVGPEKLEREPILVTPISLAGGGSGVGIVGRF